jgi:hypothetical protein
MTHEQAKALAFINAFEGRGRQGCPEITAHDELGAAKVRSLVEVGWVRTRTRWGRTFYYVSRDGKQAAGL